MNPARPLLSIRLSVDYPARPATLRDVALEIDPGEIVGLVGQSGSGKSSIALAILRLLAHKGAVVRGDIWLRGRNLAGLKESEMRRIRGREIALILQSPSAALNPALRIGTQMREAWRAHADGSSQNLDTYLLDTLRSVSLPAEPRFLQRFPGELSVGQAQRVLIAMAILHRPALLIADEPTSALDPVAQAEIHQLFSRLSRGLRMAILYISHDLLSVASLCQRVAILHEGSIVEFGDTQTIFSNPSSPHTRLLVDAIPRTILPLAVNE